MGRVRQALVRNVRVVLTSALLCALSSPAWAQQASGIAGVVTDSSGAVIPGVTVEAASPALIEKVRSVITDNAGRYSIVDLRPGTYSLTFSLAGFNTLRREGIVLTVGFTATINGVMQIGALEETVTVSGASPLVDTQNTQQQEVLGSELIQTLPTGVKGLAMLTNVVPGLRGAGADVGGASGLYTAQAFSQTTYHGKSGIKLTYDGMQINNLAGTGGNVSYAMNFATVEQMAVETGGVTAESDSNNVRVNLVPKEGGNTYRFDTSWFVTNEHLQANNLSDDLRSRGVTNLNEVLHLSDINATLGGPIMRDRLWFFSATRIARNENQVQGIYFNSTQGTPLYTPDLSRPASREAAVTSTGGRITWQVAPKHKISTFTDIQSFQVWGIGENVAMEAQTRWNFYPAAVLQATWSSPLTNRLLLDAGWSGSWQPVNQTREEVTDNLGFIVSPDDVSILEQSTGFRYNARSTYFNPCFCDDRIVERFAVSYVTGSHAFKTGFQVQHLGQRTHTVVNKDVNYSFFRGVPTSITQFATPYTVRNKVRADLGIFVQDRWTIGRLALNLGLRLDYFNGYVPAQDLPATPSGWIPERAFEAVARAPEWTDLNPRLGAAYDLFGSGRTAVKASIARYVGQMNANVAAASNPVITSVNSVTRTWNDANRNYVPDCNLGNFNENGECGPISDSNFGKNNPRATRYDDDILRGFGVRDYLWDFIAEIEQQLGSNTSLTIGYNRSWTDNPAGLRLSNPQGAVGFGTGVTDNLAVTPADHDHYCITAPLDPLLPGGGGYQLCGLYDISPTKFGQADNVVRSQKSFGTRTRTSDFIGATLSTRLGSRLSFTGNIDTGRVVEDDCFVVDSPQQLLNCRLVSPFKAETLVKVNGSYEFPGDLTASAVFQNLPGISYSAEYRATNAEVVPSLGRNLAACGTRPVCTATVVVPLVPIGTLYEPRRTQLDMRLSKRFSFTARLRVQVDVSVFNVFNSSAVYRSNFNYGPQWRQPLATSTVGSGVVDGRLVQFGGRVSW
jgi:hypothetical protein